MKLDFILYTKFHEYMSFIKQDMSYQPHILHKFIIYEHTIVDDLTSFFVNPTTIKITSQTSFLQLKIDFCFKKMPFVLKFFC